MTVSYNFTIDWPLTGRPGRPTDLPFILRQEGRQDYARFILPWPREKHATWLRESDGQYIVFQDSGERPVGFAILAGLTNKHNAVELVRMVAAHPGQGVGRAMLHSVLAHVFLTLNANRLWLDVFDDNDRARHVYGQAGFVEEGTLREVVRSGGIYRSLVIMSMLRAEYIARRAAEDDADSGESADPTLPAVLGETG